MKSAVILYIFIGYLLQSCTPEANAQVSITREQINGLHCLITHSDQVKIEHDTYSIREIRGGKPEIEVILKSGSGKTLNGFYTYLESQILRQASPHTSLTILRSGNLRAQRDGQVNTPNNSIHIVNLFSSEFGFIEGDLFFNFSGRELYARLACDSVLTATQP